MSSMKTLYSQDVFKLTSIKMMPLKFLKNNFSIHLPVDLFKALFLLERGVKLKTLYIQDLKLSCNYQKRFNT